MEGKFLLKKGGLITVKVRPETYKRLKKYQALLILQSNGEEAFTMDQVISALIDFLEAAKVKFVKVPEEQEAKLEP
jgi:uncharacterized protein with von Willebrand factor type A (vWA) domain